jgi:hypothetical protein
VRAYLVSTAVLEVAALLLTSSNDAKQPPIKSNPSIVAKSVAFNPPAVLESKGGFATYLPPPEVKAVEYIALDGEEPFPVQIVGGSPTAFVFFTRSLPPKNYRFVGVASDAGGNLTRREFVVPVGAPPKTDPPVTPPTTPTDPPVVDPPVEKPLFYFLIVRPDGPASAAHTKLMQSPAWKTLRDAGHTVKDNTLTQASASGVTIVDGTILPVVVILKGADGSAVLKTVPAPTADADILDLAKAVK